jgi:glycosyltransferase involved in cell wall biosynthesis
MVRRCLIISYYFPPVGGGGIQRIAKLIKYLSNNNWQFTVVTSQNDVITLPEDNVISNEVKHLVNLKKIPISKPRSIYSTILRSISPSTSNFINRWLSALLYIPDIRKKWIMPLHKTLINELNKSRYDCILITAPPYSLAIFAAQITRQLSIPVILDMRDPWTNNPYKIHPTKYHYNKDLQLELQSIATIKHGVSAYKSLVQFYEKMIPNFDSQRWEVIPNGYDEDDFRELKIDSFNNKFNIAFSGTFYSHINNPMPLFRSIAQLDPIVKDKILFHHIGSTQINLNKLISKFRLNSNVKIWGYLSHDECLKQLNKMDSFCFILDDRNKNSIYTIGGKVYEYLRFKKPILALVPENGEAANLINSTNSGKVISTKNIDKISSTLKDWVEGRFNFKYLGIENYTRKKQAQQFLKVLNRACAMDQN